ncbi:tumor necrosis factor receptor superfamily member 10A [Trichechus manatus latirostris]|uniref:Tumor necrosis factor receptor superfamily member 10A n=1 Tax=Trichechus manatus latirostris TaxID=127582 RepID=A0A2Y9RAS6_TRIMA|nr:tumor necrosis factor receptor superfamily member 10A [Trichechus manatus latirostris]
MSKRGASASAARGAGIRVGCPPGTRRSWGARLQLQSSGYALRKAKSHVFVALSMLLLVPADSAVIRLQDRIGKLWWELCPAGYHMLLTTGDCILCSYGVDYTNHSNDLPSCLPCTVCKPDEDEISPCILTRDTACRCKAGTFLGSDAPEICQKCSPGCPDGMVQDSPCTPWSNLKCVPREAGTKATGEATVSGEPVASGPKTPTTASPSSGFGNLEIWIRIWIGLGIGLWIVMVMLVLLRRRIIQGCGVVSKFVNRVLFGQPCSRKGPEAHDNAHNEALSNRESQPRLDPELEREGQEEQAGVTGAMRQTPVDAQPLLGHPNAEGSQMRRMLLVPANGADPTETLKAFFDYFISVVPFCSWNAVMRRMGLTDNEIHVARASAVGPKEEPYKVLVQWLHKTGKAASINTLLDALEAVGERNARETIQDYLVDSGNYTFEEDRADNR